MKTYKKKPYEPRYSDVLLKTIICDQIASGRLVMNSEGVLVASQKENPLKPSKIIRYMYADNDSHAWSLHYYRS